jgi:hypothetical protein
MSNLYRISMRVAAAVVAAFSLSAALLAQSGAVSLRGRVTDPSGASIPGATVTVTGTGGVIRQTQTDEQGGYVFRGLQPGSYTVAITAANFGPFEKTGVAIVQGKPAMVNAQLVVTMQKQQVTVQSSAATLSVNPQNNASALVIKGAALKALSDDPDELQSELQALAGPAAGPNGGQIYIDGFAGGQLPPKSDILEVRVNTDPFTAAHEKLGYGRIDVITKPGFQKFHGEIFTFGNDSVLNSRNPFVGQEPGYHSLFYHGDVGGPLGKKASFFFSIFHRSSNGVSVVDAPVLNLNFQPTTLNEAVPTPSSFTFISPRFDFQLGKNNVLTVMIHHSGGSQTNSGIGQFSLPSQGVNTNHTENELHLMDTQVVSATTVNDLRFGLTREVNSTLPASLAPTLDIRGAFTGGGSSGGQDHEAHWHSELEDMVEITTGRHNITFGGRLRDISESDSTTGGFNGTFVFPSLTAYQITQQGLAQGMTMAQIQAAGGGPSQFSITAGNPLATVNLWDVGLYAEDTYSVRPNFNLSMGLRFESQNHINDHADFAPRLGIAWGLGHSASPKTVVRAGFGIFYDRFGQGDILQAERLNGISQQRYVVNQPSFFPNIPPVNTLTGAATFPTVYQIDPSLRAPYTIESAASIERQVARNVTASVTYINSHGVHQLMTRNINAPLPGTYNPSNPSSGVRPFGDVGNIDQYESDGIYNENQIIANFSVREGAGLTLFGFYTLSYANSDPLGGFPMNQYDIAEDYGPAGFVIRNQALVGGTFAAPFGFQFSPFMNFNSGHPYNITVGQDLFGASLFNSRPAFAPPGATGRNIISTPFGVFDTQPQPGETIVPVNYLVGPSNFSVNLRLSRTFGFGKEMSEGGGFGGGHFHGHGGGLGAGGLSGSGGRGGFFRPGGGTNRRYQLTFAVMAHNVFNIVNLGTPVGTLTSPLFGKSNSLAGGFFGTGQGANRSVNLMVRFSF